MPRAPGSPHAHGRSELKERPAVMRAFREEQRRLGARLRALREDRALTQEQAAEVVTHLAFYAGWPNAFSALTVVKDVFEKRPH